MVVYIFNPAHRDQRQAEHLWVWRQHVGIANSRLARAISFCLVSTSDNKNTYCPLCADFGYHHVHSTKNREGVNTWTGPDSHRDSQWGPQQPYVQVNKGAVVFSKILLYLRVCVYLTWLHVTGVTEAAGRRSQSNRWVCYIWGGCKSGKGSTLHRVSLQPISFLLFFLI